MGIGFSGVPPIEPIHPTPRPGDRPPRPYKPPTKPPEGEKKPPSIDDDRGGILA